MCECRDETLGALCETITQTAGLQALLQNIVMHGTKVLQVHLLSCRIDLDSQSSVYIRPHD